MKTMRKFLKVTKPLSDKTRVRIFKMLQQKEMCVCEVQAVLGMAQSTVSKHLKILEDTGLIMRTKDGLWVNYRIDGHSHNRHTGPVISYLCSVLDDDAEVKAEFGQVISR
jgi:ArsR family transcriptional regulator